MNGDNFFVFFFHWGRIYQGLFLLNRVAHSTVLKPVMIFWIFYWCSLHQDQRMCQKMLPREISGHCWGLELKRGIMSDLHGAACTNPHALHCVLAALVARGRDDRFSFSHYVCTACAVLSA